MRTIPPAPDGAWITAFGAEGDEGQQSGRISGLRQIGRRPSAMTHAALHALVVYELHRARLRLQYETRSNAIGLYILLWSDFAWFEGIGGRRVFGRDPDLRRREVTVGILSMHSRVPRITFGGTDDTPPIDLWTPPRPREPVLRALVFHAIAKTAPTPRRLREAERRLVEAGVDLSDLRQKPSYARRSA